MPDAVDSTEPVDPADAVRSDDAAAADAELSRGLVDPSTRSGKEHDRRVPNLVRRGWRGHPGVRSGDALTLGERAADRLRNGMGSWPFVFGALAFLAAWMLVNRGDGFDKYPFILLNLVLSCLAALQGAILLIAAKRSDQISSELAQHDYDTNVKSHAVIVEIHQRMADLAEHNHRLLEENNHLLRRLVEASDDTAGASPT